MLVKGDTFHLQASLNYTIFNFFLLIMCTMLQAISNWKTYLQYTLWCHDGDDIFLTQDLAQNRCSSEKSAVIWL